MNTNAKTRIKCCTAFATLDAVFEKQGARAAENQLAEVSGDKRLNPGGPHELV